MAYTNTNTNTNPKMPMAFTNREEEPFQTKSLEEKYNDLRTEVKLFKKTALKNLGIVDDLENEMIDLKSKVAAVSGENHNEPYFNEDCAITCLNWRLMKLEKAALTENDNLRLQIKELQDKVAKLQSEMAALAGEEHDKASDKKMEATSSESRN